MKKITILITVLILSTAFANSQTTFKLMQFNLLNYGNDFGGCDQTSNNVSNKNGYMRTIIGYLQPDIVCVNELDNSNTAADNLLNNAFNQDGRTYYQRANLSGTSYTANMIYYDSRKFAFDYDYYIWADPRRVNGYKMHFKSDDGVVRYITFIASHLKAGTDSDDATKRANATQNIINHVAGQGAGNYVVIGDLNLYGSSETAYQNLLDPTNSSYKFYDPVNQSGEWSGSYTYRYYHTQSSHDNSNGCAVGGGMDDRFDFILISGDVKNGTNHYEYVANSYTTVAQDGQHFNQSITDGYNSSGVPSNVVQAIYNMSDHLPVTINIEVDQNLAEVCETSNSNINFNNPVQDVLTVSYNSFDNVSLQLYSITGKLIYQVKANSGDNDIDMTNIKAGLYFLKLSGNNINITKKIIKL